MKLNTHVNILEIENKRMHYTNYGLYLKALGKETICDKLKEIIEEMVMSNKETPIPMESKTNHHGNDVIQNEERERTLNSTEIRRSNGKEPVSRLRTQIGDSISDID